ncbi:MAG: biopolymer transporter TolR [Gemmatimonadota bacterium]
MNARLVVATTLAFSSTPVLAQQLPLGVFESQVDVGKTSRPGTATYDVATQRYTIEGAGQNMWADHDDFHFVYRKMTGNFILTMRTQFATAGGNEHRKVGWSIRPTLETNSTHVTAAMHGNGMASLQTRRTVGGPSEQRVTDSLPDRMGQHIVQLERRDGKYIMSVSRYGDTLVSNELNDVTLPDEVYVGMYICSHDDAVTERATFDNVRITIPARKDFVPYREYIGSHLETMDVATGDRMILHEIPGSLQAPNWTLDGKELLYSQDGLIYRFNLATRTPSVLNTAFANRNNNDHVLSFDGKMLGISHGAADDSGRSNIYTVPLEGGTPKRVTKRGPSYLHGWSPDAKWMVFAGLRDGEFDIYRVSSAGGDDEKLTNTKGVDDGPEYSPDGQYIYFNSARTGRMQIWRMKPDGSQQEQITHDDYNNWFPHFSPDGKWIVYIAFPKDIPAGDHPFYKHVYIKLIPAEGGKAKVLAYLYGGQGTINVPSWSPDGKRIAFVGNTSLLK